MLDILKAALKGGFKTSEFWLAVGALFVPLIDGAVQRVIDYLNGVQSTTHNPIYLVILAGAAAAVSGAYSIARAMLKGNVVKQIPTAAAIQNLQTSIPNGSAADEVQHALSAGASPSDLGVPNVPR